MKKIKAWAITDRDGRIFWFHGVTKKEFKCPKCKEIVKNDEGLAIWEGFAIFYIKQEAEEVLSHYDFSKKNLRNYLTISQVEIKVL